MNLPIHLVLTYFLVVARLIGTFATMPVFSRKDVPNTIKLTMVIWIAFAMVGVAPLPSQLQPSAPIFMVMFLTEIAIGMILGLMSNMLIVAVEFAGNIMDTQAGLSVASILDPATGRNTPILSTLLNWIVLIMFLSVNGHHIIITTLAESFKILPIGQMIKLPQTSYEVVMMSIEIFRIGVILAAPIILVIFMLDLGFGLLNKIAEQVNVFQLSFQVKPTVSLIILLSITPTLIDSIMHYFEVIMKMVTELLITLQK